MKKPLIILLMAIISIAVKVSAREPMKGYRGFVDLNGEALFKKKYSNDRDIVFSISGFTTTHGYQFNEHFFVGGGLGLCVMTSNYDWFSLALVSPIYAIGRIDWKIKKVPLFADVRLGSFLNAVNVSNDRLFVNPSLGYRCSWGGKISLNIGAGVSLHWFDYYSRYKCKLLPSVKLGIEFH